jgi:ABC-2 type transport system permease protein
MSSQSQSVAAFEPREASPAAPSPTRPFYWSVRRELWEYRAIYMAPLIVAGLAIFGFLIRIVQLPHLVRELASLTPMQQSLALGAPFAIVAASITGAGLIVGFFYCLGALYNERRDRSILFWKSLPVSNVTTVLSKVTVALVILPLAVLVIVLATQLVMLLVGSAVLMASGMDASILWSHWPLLKMSLIFVYALVVMTLWYAPICGWLLLVSSWARSMAILWAVLPPLGLCIAERVAVDTSHLFSLLDDRLSGFVSLAFRYRKGDHLDDPLALLTPAHFLTSPGLWIGLVLAAAFITGAIWLRRNREPI